jgi:hypothetical protein
MLVYPLNYEATLREHPRDWSQLPIKTVQIGIRLEYNASFAVELSLDNIL